MPEIHPSPRSLSITGARVLTEEGTFVDSSVLHSEDGFITDHGDRDEPDQSVPVGGEVFDATGLWVIPGVYDCHCHITWNDFHLKDRERRSPAEREAQLTSALGATLRGGVTTLRDAGGASSILRAQLSEGARLGPRLQIAVDMIGPADAGSAARMRAAVQSALDKGADWIKLMATAGSSSPGNAVLDSLFERAEIETAVRVAEAGGARVMVHTWGGKSADWAIEAGAASLEHGIYLTEEQVGRAAAAGLTLVPTLTIYHRVREMVASGALDGVPLGRIEAVIAAHSAAVRLAADNGLPIALGSDYTTPRQHGTNLAEIGTLIRAGLTGGQALLAATRNGAALLRDGTGILASGHRADAVLLSADPFDPATYDDTSNVVAVIKDGRIVDGSRPGLAVGPTQ